MSALDKEILAEKAAAVERHLARIQDKLPEAPSGLQPSTDAADAVVLHLWQAVQIVIDLALAACVRKNLGTPPNYGGAFLRLAGAGFLDKDLADRLVLASGFRNAVAHNYEGLDMKMVYEAASKGPADLRAFLGILRDQL
jgi:uncharacterized protein YutE (UPF0331/DUF86 family)